MGLAARFIASNHEALGWRCSRCDPDYVHPGDDVEASEEDLRVMRGCDEPRRQGEPFAFAPDLDRCPWAAIPPVAFALVQWEQRRKRLGVLPMGAERIGELPQWVDEALDAAASGTEVAQGIEAARSRALMESTIARLGAQGGARGS